MANPTYPSVFGDTNQYPKSVTVGDTLFPLLYIYFMGDPQRSKRVYNTEVFELGLTQYATEALASNPLDSRVTADGMIKNLKTQVTRFSSMLDYALDQNSDFVWQLKEKANSLLAVYKARIPHLNINTTGKKYYTSKDKKVCSRVPVMMDMTSFETADASLEVFRILLENNIINTSYNLGIRPINLYDGKVADVTPDWKIRNDQMRDLGLPTTGIFSVNNVPKSSWMYKTFSGIDLTALASVGDAVSPLEGLTTFTWSTHRGKQTQRTLGKSAPSGRAHGNRTIAGTMIFAVSDHHPLLKIVPSDYPVAQAAFISQDPNIWKPLMMSDEIPPFDLVLIAQNEYGFASSTMIYGIEITDEGVTVGVDNLITEMVLQYTAVAMDPIQEIPPSEKGVVDPFNIMSVKSSNIYRRRESIIAGAGGDFSLEEQWNSHMDSVFNTVIDKFQKVKPVKTSQT
jgi:hypothetical protein